MKSKQEIEKLALERIDKLFSEAEKNKDLGSRYVFLARKIAMKARISIPKIYKRKFCKYCHNYFTSKNLRVRTKNNKVVYYCLNCKKYTRYPFIKERKKRLIKKNKKQNP